VGIAEDIKDQGLAPDSTFYYYISAQQRNPQIGGLFVRTAGSGRPLIETVRKRLQQEMPGASYVTITPLTEIVGSQTRPWHLGATMFVAFGLLALVVAGVGLYSVIAYNVAQRSHELGVRMALGAQARDLARLVIVGGLRFAAAGVAIGALLALWAGRFVADLLFEVSPRDPAVFVAVTLTLGGVAVLASWIPALRASRVEPNVVLRGE
jgi:ABC-type antimicrobial peptide transport system permease subunit